MRRYAFKILCFLFFTGEYTITRDDNPKDTSKKLERDSYLLFQFNTAFIVETLTLFNKISIRLKHKETDFRLVTGVGYVIKDCLGIDFGVQLTEYRELYHKTLPENYILNVYKTPQFI